MTATKQWDVQIVISEQDDLTRADAHLQTGGDTHLTASGTARRNPHDVDVPEIGAELAAARALAALAHRLLHSAADDIEGMTDRPVRLDR